MSLANTAEASLSLAVEPDTATPPSATFRRSVPTVTWKSPGAGTEPGSRPPSNATVSSAPLIAAEANRGGVLLVIVRFETAAAWFPDRSCSRSPASLGTT